MTGLSMFDVMRTRLPPAFCDLCKKTSGRYAALDGNGYVVRYNCHGATDVRTVEGIELLAARGEEERAALFRRLFPSKVFLRGFWKCSLAKPKFELVIE